MSTVQNLASPKTVVTISGKKRTASLENRLFGTGNALQNNFKKSCREFFDNLCLSHIPSNSFRKLSVVELAPKKEVSRLPETEQKVQHCQLCFRFLQFPNLASKQE